MKEFDLDSLKSAWQITPEEKIYSAKEIFPMLKRKSMTSVKWVFIISLIEILFAVGLYVYFLATSGINDYHQILIKQYGSMVYLYEALNFIVYGISFWFIYQFFSYYRKISVQSSIRELSVDIINFRKIVDYFIKFNLVMLVIILFFGYISIWQVTPELRNMDWSSPAGLSLIAVSLIIIFVMFALIWLYYYVVYGTFQRRLKRNLKELDRMD
ncbi:MAG: hypothetical protein Q4G27_10755 [Flavobacteriaceae bacterium]|nr:hypothetical protein [Flavobacteriaceae bacterium]